MTHSHTPSGAELQGGRLGALTVPDFRVYWTASLLSNSGGWMQSMAVAWLLLEMTNSPLLLGLNWLFQAVPFIVSSMVAGAVADRMNRRRLLLLTQFGLFLVAFAQGLVVFLGVVEVWHVYLLSALGLACAGFESAARQSFLPSIVSRKHLASAIALHSTLHRSTAVIGPVFGGLAIATVGVAGALFANAVGNAILTGAVALIRAAPPEPSRSGSLWRSMVDGIVHVRRRPLLWGLMTLTGSTSLFATYTALLPIYARDILEIGPQGLGMLHSMVGAGSIAGMVGLIALGGAAARGPWIILGGLLYPCLTMGFALSTHVGLSMALMFLGGAVESAAGTMRSTLMQLVVQERFRGRVMSLQSISGRGLHQLGNVQSGVVANFIGPPAAMVAGCVLTLGYIVYLALRIPELSGRSAPGATEAGRRGTSQLDAVPTES